MPGTMILHTVCVRAYDVSFGDAGCDALKWGGWAVGLHTVYGQSACPACSVVADELAVVDPVIHAYIKHSTHATWRYGDLANRSAESVLTCALRPAPSRLSGRPTNAACAQLPPLAAHRVATSSSFFLFSSPVLDSHLHLFLVHRSACLHPFP